VLLYHVSVSRTISLKSINLKI